MPNPNRIGGVINFTIDGTSQYARGNFKVTPGTVKRDAVAGQDGPHGYTEMPIVPSIEGELTTRQGLSLTQLESIVDSTIMVELANGTSYVLSQAWTESAFEIDTAEGKFGAKFYGMSCNEI